MNTPRLNVRLVLEAARREDDGGGGFAQVWRKAGTLWAEMRAGSGRERFGEVGPESVVPWRITVRGAPQGDPRRPVAGNRLRLGQRLFQINAVAERDAAGLWLTCIAQEENLP